MYCIAGGESRKQKMESIKASKQPSPLQFLAGQLKEIAVSQSHLNKINGSLGVDGKWGGISKLYKAQLKEEKGRFY